MFYLNLFIIRVYEIYSKTLSNKDNNIGKIKIGKLICTILDFAISNNFLDSSLLQFNIHDIYKKYTVKARKVSSHVYVWYLNRFSLLLPFSIGFRTVSTILYFLCFLFKFYCTGLYSENTSSILQRPTFSIEHFWGRGE